MALYNTKFFLFFVFIILIVIGYFFIKWIVPLFLKVKQKENKIYKEYISGVENENTRRSKTKK